MADPRYEALGLAPDYAAQAADAFYGSVPELQMRGFGVQMAQPQMSDQYDIQAAYEKDIASRVQAIDPRDPEYEFKIADLFTTIEDPDAPSYDRVRLAVRAGAGRAQAYRQQAAAQQKANNDIAIQAAEAGIDPEKVRSWRDANGNYDPVVAAYTIGEVKRGNTAAGKNDPNALNSTEMAGLVELFEADPGDPDESEKTKAFQAKYGKAPASEEEWSEAYALGQEMLRLEPVRRRAEILESFGKVIPDQFKQRIGLNPQPSTVPTGEAAQSVMTPAAPPSVDPRNDTAAVDPNSPSLTLGEAERARREQVRAAAEAEKKAAVDAEWTIGKKSMEDALLTQFGGDRNKLTQLYRSVLANESSDPKEATDDLLGAANLLTNARSGTPVLISTLRNMSLEPGGRSPYVTMDRGFGSGGFVTNAELLSALARDRISIAADEKVQLPSGRTISVGVPRNVQ